MDAPPESFEDCIRRIAAPMDDKAKAFAELLLAAAITDEQRWQYCKDHSSWIRGESGDHDYMAVWVPKGSDLSCKAMREAAIDAAINALKKEE